MRQIRDVGGDLGARVAQLRLTVPDALRRRRDRDARAEAREQAGAGEADPRLAAAAGDEGGAPAEVEGRAARQSQPA
jgi:hypothetical protein